MAFYVQGNRQTTNITVVREFEFVWDTYAVFNGVIL